MGRRVLLCLLLVCSLIIPIAPANAALFGPKPGETCKAKLETKKINGKMYICDTNRIAKLVWILSPKPQARNSARHTDRYR